VLCGNEVIRNIDIDGTKEYGRCGYNGDIESILKKLTMN
jgi:hypothetical protein